MKTIFILMLVLLITGCASTSGIRVSKFEVGSIPGDNKTHKISPGEVLYSNFRYRVSPSAKIEGKFSIGILDEGAVNSDLILTKLSGREGYCGEFDRYTPGYVKKWEGCFIDKDSDMHFEKLIYSGGITSINGNPRYIKKNNISEGFRHEIIFQGRTEKTVKFKYREFSRSMARPAFSQDIEYFLNKDGTTSGKFKGLNIEVVSVEGNYISYRVTGEIGN